MSEQNKHAVKQEIEATLKKYINWKTLTFLSLLVVLITDSPIGKNKNIYLVSPNRFGENFAHLEAEFHENEMLLVEHKNFKKEKYEDLSWNRVFVSPTLVAEEHVIKEAVKLRPDLKKLIELSSQIRCGYAEIENETAANDMNYYLFLDNESKSKLSDCIKSLKFDGRRWSIFGFKVF